MKWSWNKVSLAGSLLYGHCTKYRTGENGAIGARWNLERQKIAICTYSKTPSLPTLHRTDIAPTRLPMSPSALRLVACAALVACWPPHLKIVLSQYLLAMWSNIDIALKHQACRRNNFSFMAPLGILKNPGLFLLSVDMYGLCCSTNTTATHISSWLSDRAGRNRLCQGRHITESIHNTCSWETQTFGWNCSFATIFSPLVGIACKAIVLLYDIERP